MGTPTVHSGSPTDRIEPSLETDLARWLLYEQKSALPIICGANHNPRQPGVEAQGVGPSATSALVQVVLLALDAPKLPCQILKVVDKRTSGVGAAKLVHCVLACVNMLKKLLVKITRRDSKQSGSDPPTSSPPSPRSTIPIAEPQTPTPVHSITPEAMPKRKQAAQGARNTARYANGLVRKTSDALTHPLFAPDTINSHDQSPQSYKNGGLQLQDVCTVRLLLILPNGE